LSILITKHDNGNSPSDRQVETEKFTDHYSVQILQLTRSKNVHYSHRIQCCAKYSACILE